MFTFGPQHAWQGNTTIQQVLVFPNSDIRDRFDKLFQEEVKSTGIEHSDDAGKGAIYKIKATKTEAGNYTPAIRCGVTGKLLWQGADICFTAEMAIITAASKLIKDVVQSFAELGHRYE